MNSFSGKLVLNDDNDYELHSLDEIVNISKVFQYIYYHPSCNQIDIRVTHHGKELFDENGDLYKKKDKYGLYSYFVCGASLEEVLFNSTDKELEIQIQSGAFAGERHETEHREYQSASVVG